MLIKLSDYKGRKIYRDYEEVPYTIQFRCGINETFVLVSLDKLDGKWRCHFVEHADETCEYCGNVQLYTKCWEFTDVVRNNYDFIMDWLNKNKPHSNE